MRNIDEKVLEIAFKSETGSYKESVPFRDYVEWLEEKVTEHLEKIRKVNLQKTKYRKMDKWMRKVGMV